MKRIAAILFLSILQLPLAGQVKLKEKVKFKLADLEKIRTIAFATNSKRLVAGGDKGSISVYDISNGDKWNIPSHPAKIVAVTFSYDNRYLAAASDDGTFSMYDFQDSKVQKMNGETGLIKCIAFSPTGRILATGTDNGRVSLWDINTREKVANLFVRESKILSIAFSPDGKWLATGDADKTVSLWSVESGTLIRQLTGHQDWVRAISFAADGKVLASGSYDKSIRFWDIASGKAISNLQLHKNWVTDLRYSGDGQYLASSGARGEVIISRPDGQVVQKIEEFDQLVTSVSFSPDGKWLAVADLEESVDLFDCSALQIQPWKPYDISPPSIVVLSPKLITARDATTGARKAVVHQATVRILLEVSDLSGVAEVSLNNIPLTPDPNSPGRYSSQLQVPINTDQTLLITSLDKAGNRVEEKLLVEHKPFVGNVDGERYHAILIAVQDYKNDDIQDLDQPAKDMERLHQTLVKNYGFNEKNITVLTNPDRNSLYDKFDELQSKLDKMDNLLIFYAGHGFWDPQLEQGYWLPSDAEPNRRSSWVSNGTLRDYIGGINARHTLLITDACFSGGIFKSRAVFDNASTAIETLYLRKSRKAMTSGTLEKVPDKSVFIDALIRKLESNQEPYLTAEELFSSIRHEVINRSPNNQVPQYGEVGQTGDDGGEFIFIRKN